MAHSRKPLSSGSETLREDADVSTSSDDYARRFAGPVGEWFVDIQTRTTLALLGTLAPGASVLDVGGGHAQVAPPLIDAGYAVTVIGSDSSCRARLGPWIDQGRCRFDVGDLRSLPYPDQSFDAAVCFRLLSHSVSWTGLIGELCRVARQSVVLDYPSLRSVNILAERMFALKKGIELNTRRFLMFTPGQISEAFAEHGFTVRSEQPQFLFPMVLHRLVKSPKLSRIAEGPARFIGLTRWLGSPILIRADRRG